MTTVQMMMRPRRCIEQERVSGIPTEKGLLVTLIFILKDTASLAAAIKRNATANRCRHPPQPGLSSTKMALITSECGTVHFYQHQMALITSGCVPFSKLSASSGPDAASAECCTDPVVANYFAKNPATRLASFKVKAAAAAQELENATLVRSVHSCPPAASPHVPWHVSCCDCRVGLM